MKKKAGIFISAGIGDAILLIPLVKYLKSLKCHVTGIITSKYPCEEIFNLGNTFDDIIVARTKTEKLKLMLFKIKKFDNIYVNNFAGTFFHLIISSVISKNVITNMKLKRFKIIKQVIIEILNIKIKKPQPNIHDSVQNIRLINDKVDHKLNEEKLKLDIANSRLSLLNEKIDGVYIVVQMVSANNQVQFKNWPIESWAKFFDSICQTFPKIKFILLGDHNEEGAASYIIKRGYKNLESYVGKTNLIDVVGIIRNSKLLLGLDGGLMHIAASLGIPTLTIWGASSELHYGYQAAIPSKHFIVKNKLPCQPCNLWINPNQTRVKNPTLCPDYKCIKGIQPEAVINKFEDVMRALNICAE